MKNMSTKLQSITLKKQPWHNLCDLQGLQGVIVEWGVFPQSLLQITNNRAQALPCGKAGGCYMNVVSHDDEHVGICTSEPRRCDRRSLKNEETILYRLNTNALLNKIAEATHCHVQTEAVSGLPNTWKVGQISPQGEFKFSVFVSLAGTTSGLDKVVNQLSFQGTPFILVGNLGSLFSHAAMDASAKVKAKLIGLDDLLTVTDVGGVEVKDSAAGLISGWVEGLIPKSQKPGAEYFYPTPPNAAWGEFVLEFTADEMINVTCRDKFERLEPEHFKMKDQRTKRPTSQWAIFKALAMAGEFGWKEDKDRGKATKQKEEFSKKLKATFRMSDDPLEFNEAEYVYKPNFIMRGKESLTEYKKLQRLA
jgi:hypothetical protein